MAFDRYPDVYISVPISIGGFLIYAVKGKEGG
jgi:hypothetical protein